MAENPSHELTWLLELDQAHLDYLGPIRHWSQLEVATMQDCCWVKGLTGDQLQMPEIKSIPFKKIFYEKDNQLFPYGSRLPVKKLPSPLLWMPLEKGLPLSLPSFNHNYFGIEEKLTVRLAPSAAEQPATALLITLKALESYILSAPAIRLKPLDWTIVDDQALIIGAPLLPLPGVTWWKTGNSLLPAGYAWEWPTLSGIIEEELNDGGHHWLLWQPDGSYLSIPKDQFSPLSISSFRLTMAGLSSNRQTL
jgi:MoxR-vWA-beta-propeller ternary system domain bpX2